MEPQKTRKANDGQRLLADASERRRLQEHGELWLLVSIAKLFGFGRTAGQLLFYVQTGHKKA